MPPRTFLTESDVKAEVKKLLIRHKWFWWMPAANGFGATGVADFCALRGGVFLAVETKMGTKKPTEKQKAFLETVMAEDGLGFVVNDRNLPNFKLWLEGFDAAVAQVGEGEKVSASIGADMLNNVAELTALIVGLK